MPLFRTIFPDCMSYLGGSQFIDSPAIGNYAQYITRDIIPFITSSYPCSHLVIAGHSSGGYGALRLAMTPRTLRCRSLSCRRHELSSAYSADIPAINTINQAGTPRDSSITFGKDTFSGGDFSVLACFVCLQPTPDITREDFPAKLPFDYHNGQADFKCLKAGMYTIHCSL